MAPTTLVTFRVRAPPATRSLDLYGSWDNFTNSYRMSKDLQAGSEYWSGCFNFTNIICDGSPSDAMKSRDGGLKMGGTYWYHYKIDDVTDFHNVCERATTNCPLMPGQLVNVLNVPYAFSRDRSRDPSTERVRPDHHTMNPQDRFMNPRPAPAKPKILRVNTSPIEATFSSSNDVTPMKEAPATNRLRQIAKKGSIDSYSTSSNGALAGGLRAAFKIRTARSQSPSDRETRRESHHTRTASAGQTLTPQRSIEEPSRRGPQRGLLLRSASDESVPTMSFGQHRRQLSRSPGRIPGRNISPPRQVEALALASSSHTILAPLQEVPSKGNSPVDEPVSTLVLSKSELDLEKRLPTLPNTPSSAYPASIGENSPPKRPVVPAEQLDSHFSTTTIDTDVNPLSMALMEGSRFSAWTTTTRQSSVFYESSVPLPDMPAYIRPVNQSPTTEAFLPTVLSSNSMSSSISTTPSTSFDDTDLDFETVPQLAERGTHMRRPPQIPYYSLPEDGCSSQTTLKMPSQEHLLAWQDDPSSREEAPGKRTKPANPQIVHSETMQRLLEELSYLSESINLH